MSGRASGSAAPGTTARVAGFVADLTYDQIPSGVVERVQRQFLDVLGVGLAGMRQDAGRIATRFVERQASRPEATVWGAGLRGSAVDCAFANGVAAHALDFDDIWLPGAHPSSVIVPAALAVAESRGASGRELITGLLAGYEVMGRLGAAANGRAGWHPTGIFGALGAAVAAAKLLGLDAEATAVALGIASSHASGIDVHEGTMTKPLHAGQAARSGVASALLAGDGFTASDRVLETGKGFFGSFYRDLPYAAWRVTAGLGEPPYYLDSPGIGLKLYPAGYLMHHAFEAALELTCTHDIHPDDVESIEIGFRPASRFNRPAVRSGLEGKFSLQYVVVMAILDRELTIESFSAERARSDRVQHMLALTSARIDDELPESHDVWHSPVTITLRDGRSFTATQPLPTSHWRYPLDRADWVAKFERNAAYALSPERAGELLGTIEDLAAVEDVRLVGELLAGAADRRAAG